MCVSSLGREIRRLRQAQGFTQEGLAALTGDCVKQSDISSLERGHRLRPSQEKVRALATALGVPYYHLAELAYELDVTPGTRRGSVSLDEVIRDELWGELVAQRPDLLARLRAIRETDTAEGYRRALDTILRFLIANIEVVIDLRDGEQQRTGLS